MNRTDNKLRVLYSFPHKLGADRICYTAWQQVNGLADAGADLLVFPGALQRAVPAGVRVRKPTLARGKLRIPYKVCWAPCARWRSTTISFRGELKSSPGKLT
jgi:hypothetical protein